MSSHRPLDASAVSAVSVDNELVDRLDLPVVVFSGDTTIDRFNAAAAALLSLTASDVGRPLRDVRRLAGMTDLEALCAHVLRGGAPSQRQVKDPDGSWFLARIVPYTRSAGQIAGAVLTLTNVTALHASIEQAIQEREYTKAILNTVSQPLVVLDANFKVLTANRAFYTTFHVSREETEGVVLSALGNRQWDIPRLRPLLEEVLSEDRPLENFEVEHDFAVIGTRTMLLSARRLSRVSDAERLILLAIEDITLRKRAETREQRARRDAEEKTEIVETINRIGRELAAQTEIAKLVQAFTDDATRLAGARFGAFIYNVVDERGESYTLYTLSGTPRSAFEQFPLPRNTAVFGPTFPGGRIIRIDDVKADPRYGMNPPHYGMPRGHLPVTSYLAVPVVSRTGEVIGGLFLGHERPGVFSERLEPIMAGIAAQLAVAIDNARLIEREQRARASAEAAREVAETASRAKDEFLAVLSHELRTPLNAVYGWARMLRSGDMEPDAVKRALDVIMRNANAQVQLIDEMLDVSRIVTGKMRLDVRPLDLRSVIEGALDAVQPAAEAREIRLQASLGPRPMALTGDPDRLQQVVWNLLINAVKFTPKGGRVEVRLQTVVSHVEIVISDTGQGISPELLPHIFERFRQADSSTTRQHTGLGLGLALVRHLVELHGGQVKVDSAGEGEGSTFTVRLPIALGRPEERDEAQPRTPRGGARTTSANTGPSLHGLRVLVIDDDADGLALVAAILANAGAEARGCASAAEGFHLLTSWQPDVLISDIEMPDEDGCAFIRKVRTLDAAQGGRTPAVALTAHGRVGDRLRTLAAGFSMHVPKPVDPAELATMIASLAGR